MENGLFLSRFQAEKDGELIRNHKVVSVCVYSHLSMWMLKYIRHIWAGIVLCYCTCEPLVQVKYDSNVAEVETIIFPVKSRFRQIFGW